MMKDRDFVDWCAENVNGRFTKDELDRLWKLAGRSIITALAPRASYHMRPKLILDRVREAQAGLKILARGRGAAEGRERL